MRARASVVVVGCLAVASLAPAPAHAQGADVSAEPVRRAPSGAASGPGTAGGVLGVTVEPVPEASLTAPPHLAPPTPTPGPGLPAVAPGPPPTPQAPGAYAEPDDDAVEDDAWVLRPEPGRAVLRVLGSLGGGTLGIGLLGGAGLLVLWALQDAGDRAQFMAGMATAVAAGVGLGAGVALSAEALGGEGRAGDMVLGELIGALVALPLLALGIDDGRPGIAVASAVLLPLTGAVAAYEISHASRELGRPRVAVAPLRRGAYAAYARRFP
ncbi:MAG: hypothetical protein ACFCGT_15525 [Sandaracinaceae bacterium]